ncbi:ribonuclease H-like domain-containing protein, partial [Haloferax profundi]|uniref:ribonuclease H-like domain-containing protein n=1 Tax=Haloferax profundi TaxID=1544718 RepID=UPI0018D1F7CC
MLEISLEPSQRVNRYGVLDIETNGTDPSCSQLVAIGVGEYDDSRGSGESGVLAVGDFDGDERSLIRGAYDWLNEREHQTLVTYNGRGFDMGFYRLELSDLIGTAYRLSSNARRIMSTRLSSTKRRPTNLVSSGRASRKRC